MEHCVELCFSIQIQIDERDRQLRHFTRINRFTFREGFKINFNLKVTAGYLKPLLISMNIHYTRKVTSLINSPDDNSMGFNFRISS